MATSPNAPQLMLPRLLNLLVNPFATFGFPANFQKNIYTRGGASAYSGMEGANPVWLTADVTLGAFKTARGHFPLPYNFYLLAFLASASVNAVGGFRGVLYDTTRRLPFTMRPCTMGSLAGQGNSPMFAGVPYRVDDTAREPKIKFTIYNLENEQNLIELVLYGVQTPD